MISSVLAPRMIGRQLHLRELERYLQAAREGAGRVVLLAGEAGMGKTRLLLEFVEHARASADIELLAGRCYDEEPALPYGPFIDIIKMGLREMGAASIAEAAGPWLNDLARLVPELAPLPLPPNGSDDAQAQKRRLFETIGRIIRPTDPASCRIVVLEDIHWSDQTSQELIRYLARVIEHERVLLVATYRTDELNRRHPLTHLLAYLTRERLSDEVRLNRLSRDELGEMLETTLGRPLPGQFVDALNSHSEGNPFFVEEILKSLVEDDQLDALIDRVRDGKSINHIAIPESIKDSILNRTSGLDDATGAVLYYAAVVGRRFDFDLLLRLTHLDETALLHAVEQLVASQIVVEEPSDDDDQEDDHYRFRHALIREAIYDDMLGRERRIKHREVLQVLEERGPEPCEADQLAHHAYQARDFTKAARYARLAAERAQRLYAYREALSGYQLALELLDSDDPAERADLLHCIAQAAYYLGDATVAMRAWREAQPLYEEAGDRLHAGDMAWRLARIQWERNDFPAAFATLDGALAMLEAEPPSSELGMTYSTYSHVYMVMGRNQESMLWGEKALRLADTLGDEVIQAHALNNMGVALAGLGAGDQGVAHLRRSLELSKKHGMMLDTVRAYLNLGSTLSGNNQVVDARAVWSEGIAFAEQFGLSSYVSMLSNKLGAVEMEVGHWPEVEQLFLRANTMDRQMATPLSYGNPLLGELRLRQGRLTEAVQEAERTLQQIDLPREDQPIQVALCVLMRAHYALGDLPSAVEALTRWHATWDTHGLFNKLRIMIADGIEIALAAGLDDLAHTLLKRIETPPIPHCDDSWLVALPPMDAYGVFAAHEGRHTEAAAHFDRASKMWHKHELPYYEGRSRRHRALSLLQTSAGEQRTEALRELSLAKELFATLGAGYELAQTNILIKDASARRPARAVHISGLTPREQQVIALVARGYSNRAIAETLVIAEKTAEVHVSNILGKLGFGSRAQAAAYAVEQGMMVR